MTSSFFPFLAFVPGHPAGFGGYIGQDPSYDIRNAWSWRVLGQQGDAEGDMRVHSMAGQQNHPRKRGQPMTSRHRGG